MSNVLFGRILDALNKNPNDQNAFRQGIDVICVAFTVLGAINLLTGSVQVRFNIITIPCSPPYAGVLLVPRWRTSDT